MCSTCLCGGKCQNATISHTFLDIWTSRYHYQINIHTHLPHTTKKTRYISYLLVISNFHSVFTIQTSLPHAICSLSLSLSPLLPLFVPACKRNKYSCALLHSFIHYGCLPSEERSRQIQNDVYVCIYIYAPLRSKFNCLLLLIKRTRVFCNNFCAFTQLSSTITQLYYPAREKISPFNSILFQFTGCWLKQKNVNLNLINLM